MGYARGMRKDAATTLIPPAVLAPAKISLARFATTERALAKGLVMVLVMTVVASESYPRAVLGHVHVLGLVLAAAVLET